MHTNRHSPQSEGGAFVGLDWDLGRNPAKQALKAATDTPEWKATAGKLKYKTYTAEVFQVAP